MLGFAFGIPGFLLNGAGGLMAMQSINSDEAPVFAFGLMMLGQVLFLVGLAFCAMYKGYHALLGVACGFFGCIGLVVLAALPDKHAR